ncbi:DUF4232 domain-containing protein [Streptomyces phaeochromogenes]|uniref:DUF4232 domain-containing protein n=1 Tax=Streptomyces phaeochromogenes TaxID=1923 RepID=A0ABZ1HII2_STRPH|nr:DUF4232 domain-containing protein [Streptomyces phaeochromogenes]MCX5604543.1 DUF4232 domain-containing protein [Streptomyces phaeochromogenes]WSD17061.1 DUF4232 domain-containing protein [Streptomyces phaeochromogenes]WSJ06136.1 DUF4232 domain-containing protein [Streptomyces phaeochromogenes]
MSARTTRTRVLAAAALAVATLTLTACNNGEGVRDEGASAGTTSKPSSTPTSESQKNKETTTDAGQAASSSGSNSKPKDGKGAQNSSGSKGSSDSSKSSGSQDSGPTRTSCTTANSRMTATVVSRPLNHLLLTVTNTGSKNCNVIGYPAVRFGEAQSVPPVFEDSKPQAVVTLAPGESGYAGVLLSAADGSGSNGYTAKSLQVYLNKDAGAAFKPSLPAKGVYVDDSISVTYWQQTMADALTW